MSGAMRWRHARTYLPPAAAAVYTASDHLVLPHALPAGRFRQARNACATFAPPGCKCRMGGPLPPDRRRRRFRRPGTGRWLTESLPTLRIELASTVRATLTAWMRLYGEANNVRGLATGPIETRFARLRQTCAAETLIVWTTPTRWAAGEGLSLRFPQLHLEFTCSLGEGHL